MACFVWSQNLHPGDVYKRDHSIIGTLLAYSTNLTSESNCNVLYDVFDLPYDEYFMSATSSAPSRAPQVRCLPLLAALQLQYGRIKLLDQVIKQASK